MFLLICPQRCHPAYIQIPVFQPVDLLRTGQVDMSQERLWMATFNRVSQLSKQKHKYYYKIR